MIRGLRVIKQLNGGIQMRIVRPLEKKIDEIIEDLKEKSKEPERLAHYKKWQEDQRDLNVNLFIKTSGLPSAYRNKSFDFFTVTAENKPAYETCIKYVRNWENWEFMPRGLALFGDIGTGKSHLAAAVILDLIKKLLLRAKYANVLHTFELIKESFDGGKNPLPALLDCDFLVLDDLGSERPTAWALEQTSHIIDYRLSEGLPIMITSNAKNWSGLQKMLLIETRGPLNPGLMLPVGRIIDRLREACGDPVVIKGKSWRSRLFK